MARKSAPARKLIMLTVVLAALLGPVGCLEEDSVGGTKGASTVAEDVPVDDGTESGCGGDSADHEDGPMVGFTDAGIEFSPPDQGGDDPYAR